MRFFDIALIFSKSLTNVLEYLPPESSKLRKSLSNNSFAASKHVSDERPPVEIDTELKIIQNRYIKNLRLFEKVLKDYFKNILTRI